MKLNQSNKFELPRLKKCTICFENNNFKNFYELISLELYTGIRIFPNQFIKSSLNRNTSKLHIKLTIRGNQLYNWLDDIILNIKITKTFYNFNFGFLLFIRNNNAFSNIIYDNIFPVKLLLIFSSKISFHNKLLISYFNYDFIG
uniref:50S ribosomal protein L5 n=1 Tax=Cyanidiococcus yangmingshanensis TaxID=2690220 RepID=A0A7G5VUC7_9RHOD|nr:50S ribosomal protein L5 [Cyanidiococcus yangmingshanensis]QMX77294.1 50S ribosomal protein L5 [Cyanidiococcus yangmingshanensis]